MYRYNFWNEVEIKTGCSVFLFTCKTSVISLHGSWGETSFLDKFYGVSFFQSIFYLEVMFGFWYFKQLLIWRGEQLLWSHGQLCHSVIICLFLKPVCYSKTRKGLDMVFMFMLLFQSLCIILELIRRVLLLSSEQYNVYKSFILIWKSIYILQTSYESDPWGFWLVNLSRRSRPFICLHCNGVESSLKTHIVK